MSDPETVLDAHQEAPGRRHEAISTSSAAVGAGPSLALVHDHDPKPVYGQFAASAPAPVRQGPPRAGTAGASAAHRPSREVRPRPGPVHRSKVTVGKGGRPRRAAPAGAGGLPARDRKPSNQ